MKKMNDFMNKRLLITGGTGSFGNAVLNRFLDTDIGEIRIFSRDEKKQDDGKRGKRDQNPLQQGFVFHARPPFDAVGLIRPYRPSVTATATSRRAG